MNYNNIKTCEEHKKISIPPDVIKRIKEGIKRSISLAAVPLVLFTACSGSQESKKDIESTTLPGYTDILGEDTSSRSSGERIDYNSQSNTSTLTYSDLVNKLNEELAKKNFSKEANDSIREILDKLYKNYPQWQGVYRDLPNVSSYIESNLINAIKNIPEIEIIKADSEEGRIFIDAGEPLGTTGNETNNIRMIYLGGEEHDKDLERLYHEIHHGGVQTDKSNSTYFNPYEELEEITKEGRFNISPKIYKSYKSRG